MAIVVIYVFSFKKFVFEPEAAFAVRSKLHCFVENIFFSKIGYSQVDNVLHLKNIMQFVIAEREDFFNYIIVISQLSTKTEWSFPIAL